MPTPIHELFALYSGNIFGGIEGLASDPTERFPSFMPEVIDIDKMRQNIDNMRQNTDKMRQEKPVNIWPVSNETVKP